MTSIARCPDCARHLETRAVRRQKIPSKYRSRDYERLPHKRGYIRVLQLRAGSYENPNIECELVIQEFNKDKELAQPYEALSWCWGTEKPTSYLSIHKDKKVYAKMVKSELFSALKALRHPKDDRFLWIDAVSIDQDNPQEKNHQVEIMSEIYRRANQVCVWLGDGDETSRMALNFIRKEVLQLQNFDELCESEQASEKWGALLNLMQRPWFSRRWVVQEIALTERAEVYCGSDKISWKKFAVAVELFVEVETATHRLSEVMKKDPKFYHVPGWFEYVSALGASLLVEATGKLFRDYKPTALTTGNTTNQDSRDEESETESESESRSDLSEDSDIDSSTSSDFGPEQATETKQLANNGQALLSLEYLVSSLSIFDVTIPHDAVYTLLAIAKDTIPVAGDDEQHLVVDHAQEALEGFTQKKRYKVDYTQPFSDVCKEFVQFCIDQASPSRALDIICRPWAPEIPNPPKRANPGVIDRPSAPLRRAKTTTTRDLKVPEESASSKGKSRSRKASPESSQEVNGRPAQEEAKKSSMGPKKMKDIPLPSWIQQLDGAAYAMLPQAGIHTLKMGRKNADSLVGLPTSSQNLQQNYNAAETKGIDAKTLCFKKRTAMKHHSLYVKGFVLDTIAELQPSSQGGAIPSSWARAGSWRDVPHSDPPDDFWRTLVADRGRDGRNPPVYYSRACKESFLKGGLSSGSVNTTDLINNERCSVVAQFCRRVQAVIWNRRLIKTATGRLGLASQYAQLEDVITILYGCSVPVVLRRKWKTLNEVNQEIQEDIQLWKKDFVHTWQEVCKTRKSRRVNRAYLCCRWTVWDHEYRKKWEKDRDWDKKWKSLLDDERARQANMSRSELTAFISSEEGASIGNCLRNKGESQEDYDRRMRNKSYELYKRDRKADAEIKEVPWTEPQPRRREFQLFLKFGRRWKMAWARTNELNLAKERLGETERKERAVLAAARRRLFVIQSSDQDIRKKAEEYLSKLEADQQAIRLAAQDRLTVLESLDRKTRVAAKERLDRLQSMNEALYTAAGEGKENLRCHTGRQALTADGNYEVPADSVPDIQVNGGSMDGASSEAFKDEPRQESSAISYDEPPGHSATLPNGSTNLPDAIDSIVADDDPEAYMDTLKESLAKKFKLKPDDELKEPEQAERVIKSGDSEDVQRWKQQWCYYEVLGEAYVHGMMDGEAMAFQNEHGIRAQVFELR